MMIVCAWQVSNRHPSRYSKGKVSMKRRGFTLIELLVVIAIIAILAAILFPIFLAARESAKMRSCASNLKQMGTAFRMYCDEYNGFSIPDPGVVANIKPWPEILAAYSKSKATPSVSGGQLVMQNSTNGYSIFLKGTSTPYTDRAQRPWICPGDKDGIEQDSNRLPMPARWKRDGSSYSMFYCQTNPANYPSKGQGGMPARPDAWAKPSRDYLIADTWFNFHYGRRESDDATGRNFGGNGVEANNRKILNVVMMDGHVRAGSRMDKVTWYPGALRNALVYDNPYNIKAQFDKQPIYPPGVAEPYSPSKGKD